MVALLTRLGIQNLRFARALRSSRQIFDPAALGLLDECRRKLRSGTSPVVFETKAVNSPALYGLFRPRLLLPEGLLSSFGPDELRHVFLHELGHLKRHDMAINCLANGLKVLHWFNPLVWVAFNRMSADREAACDALVLSRLGVTENQAYGQTILKVLAGMAENHILTGALGILEDTRQIAERLRLIANPSRRQAWSVPVLFLFVGLGLVGLTDAQPSKAPASVLSREPFHSPASPSGSVLSGNPALSGYPALVFGSIGPTNVEYDLPGGRVAYTQAGFAGYDVHYAHSNPRGKMSLAGSETLLYFRSGPATNIQRFECRLVVETGEQISTEEVGNADSLFGVPSHLRVAKEILLDSSDIVQAELTGGSPGASLLDMTLNTGGAEKLSAILVRYHNRQLAILIGAKLVTTIPVGNRAQGSHLSVAGPFDPFQMDYIKKALVGRPPGWATGRWERPIIGFQSANPK